MRMAQRTKISPLASDIERGKLIETLWNISRTYAFVVEVGWLAIALINKLSSNAELIEWVIHALPIACSSEYQFEMDSNLSTRSDTLIAEYSCKATDDSCSSKYKSLIALHCQVASILITLYRSSDRCSLKEII